MSQRAPRIRAAYASAPRVLACMGDSLTLNYTLGMNGWEFYPNVMAGRLRDLGLNVLARNWGVSGSTSGQMLVRFAVMTNPRRLDPPVWEVPDLAVLWAGTNDLQSVASLTSTGTTATCTLAGAANFATGDLVTITGATPIGFNVVAAPIIVTSAAGANPTVFTFTVPGGLSSPATGTISARIGTTANLVSMVRNLQGSPLPPSLAASTSGGQLAAAAYNYQVTALDSAGNESYPSAPANVPATTTGTTGSVTVTWSPVAYASGYRVYGRAASGVYRLMVTLGSDQTSFVDVGGVTPGAAPPSANAFTGGCQRIIVLGQHMQNTPGGDTVSAQSSYTAGLAAAQQAAVTAVGGPGVVYCDQYAAMRSRLVAGLDLAGSASWHISTSNAHLNAYGESITAAALLATVQAQSGWASALS